MKKILLFWLVIISNLISAQKDSANFHFEREKFEWKKTIVPASLMITGIIADSNKPNSLKFEIKKYRDEHFPNFRNHTDDYLQFAPFAALYGFEFLGMKPQTDWKNRTAILVKSEILNLGMVYILKKSLHETRPDGSEFSFPSGHTANVFAGATLLSMEYGKTYKWVPYAAYGTASVVGATRMMNNKHYISDVLFGAGLGILSVKIAYWTHQYKWNRTKTEDFKPPVFIETAN